MDDLWDRHAMCLKVNDLKRSLMVFFGGGGERILESSAGMNGLSAEDRGQGDHVSYYTLNEFPPFTRVAVLCCAVLRDSYE